MSFSGRELADGSIANLAAAAAVGAEKPALLPPEALDATDSDDGSWEAFVGKMACKGEMLGLDREEQIVVKQQMLDRLMLLERELHERTVVIGNTLLYFFRIFIGTEPFEALLTKHHAMTAIICSVPNGQKHHFPSRIYA